jgi:hypothetical protein
MKKIKLFGKLNLNKQKIVKLNNDQMNGIIGGAGITDTGRTIDTARALDTTKATADSIAAIK